jgi:glycosyltransferase involved in cell wall biosynthesis
MGKDLLTRPYGRFYYLPKLLADRGHEVYLLLLSYEKEADVTIHAHGFSWTSTSIFNTGPIRYMKKTKEIVRDEHPDWVIGFSDTYYGIFAQKLANRYGARSAIDAYDNYEGYIPWLQPLHYLWRKSLSRATLVTAAGPSLIQEFQKSRGAQPSVIVPMAADPSGFVPLDRRTCRKGLNLPLDKKLIGYCGGVSSSRGIEPLFDAFAQLSKRRPDAKLILSGRKDRNIKLPTDAHWLGYLPDEAVPRLLNSLDVLVVSNRPSKFGKFSHPVKLYEAMACNIPVVASATPSTQWILKDHPELLVEPENPSKLCETIERVLTNGHIDYGDQADWQTSCEIFEQALEKYR